MVRVHPTALAARLSQRVATMAQRSTSMALEGMLKPVRVKEKKKWQGARFKSRGKRAGPKPAAASLLLKGAQSTD